MFITYEHLSLWFVEHRKISREVSQLLESACGLKYKLSREGSIIKKLTVQSFSGKEGGRQMCGVAKVFLVRRILVYF